MGKEHICEISKLNNILIIAGVCNFEKKDDFRNVVYVPQLYYETNPIDIYSFLYTVKDIYEEYMGNHNSKVTSIILGCENQAWDISYLSNWSTIYGSKEAYSKEFMFATNDYHLKRIFINTHGPNGVNGLLYEVFSKKDYNKILDYIEERMENRVKPDFGKDPQSYFKKLIKKEKEELMKTLGIKDV